MKQHKKWTSRILSLLLTAVMIFSVMPVSAFAEEQQPPLGASGTITAFASLGEYDENDVMLAEQYENVGTAQSELDLPQTLTATVQADEDETASPGTTAEEETVVLPQMTEGIIAAQGFTTMATAQVSDVGDLNTKISEFNTNTFDLEITIEADFTTDNLTPITTINNPNGKKLTIKSSSSGTKKITRGSSNYYDLFTVINGELILENITIDGNKAMFADAEGSLVYVADGGTLTMKTGATLQDNINASGIGSGGGGAYIDGGTFNMNGGEISGNEATCLGDGGGVYIDGGTFNMNDGKISGNTATYNGGGVEVSNGTFNMNGGEISGNTAADYGYGGGVDVFDGTFNVSGSPKITENKIGNGAADTGGVYLVSGRTIAISSALTADAHIGIEGMEITNLGTPVTSGVATALEYFYISSPNTDSSSNKYIGTSGSERYLEKVGNFIVLTATAPSGGGSTADYTANTVAELNSAITGFNGANADKTIEITGDFDTGNTAITAINNTNNKKLTIKSASSSAIKKITRGKTGNLFTVTKGELVLENITIDGGSTGSSFQSDGGGSLVYVGDTGTLTMKTGATLQNNIAATSFKDNGGGVNNNGTFTMNAGSKILNCSAGKCGGGVYNNGTFEMTGGEISGNTSTANGGGGVYNNSGTFNMSGGEISGNTTSSTTIGGGGVYILVGTFNMSGTALITGNTANINGGGVYIASNTTFNMSGTASITGNTASTTYGGGGVYMLGGTFNVSGSPTITGNIKGVGGDADTGGVYLNTDNTINLSGALAAGAHIGIEDMVTKDPGTAVTSGAATVLEYFYISSPNTDSSSNKYIGSSGSERYLEKVGDFIVLTATAPSGGGSTADATASTITELKTAIGTFNGGNADYVIEITANFDTGGTFIDAISNENNKTLTIKSTSSNNFKITRGTNNYSDLFQVSKGKLVLENITIDGGSTSSNPNGVSGSLVKVSSNATFTMNTGAILQNNKNNPYDGGGVLNNGTFNMNGGEISGNTARDGKGGAVYNNGTFNVSGSPKITGNIKGSGANTGGVYLESNKTIAITTALAADAHIGIEGMATTASGTAVATGAVENDLQYFSISNVEGNINNFDLVMGTGGDTDKIVLGTPAAADASVGDTTALNGAIGTFNGGDADYVIEITDDFTTDSSTPITTINNTNGNKLTIKSSSGGTKKITRGKASELFTVTKGELILQSITIDGNKSVGPYNTDGGGSLVKVNGGTFTMKTGATLQNNIKANGNGGGVNNSSGTFTMNAGSKILNCSAGAGYYGGGVVNNGTFEMTGGEISGNTTPGSGGGVGNINSATFNMSGGEIKNNEANSTFYGGGGVFIYGGTFNMSGTASITGNTASFRGGGVHIANSTTFNMSGTASITGNTAVNNSGGGVYHNGTFKVSGTPTITGNKIGSGTPDADTGGVDMSPTIVIDTAIPLTTGARIGIESIGTYNVGTAVTSGASTALGYFYISSPDKDSNGNKYLGSSVSKRYLEEVSGIIKLTDTLPTTPPSDEDKLTAMTIESNRNIELVQTMDDTLPGDVDFSTLFADNLTFWAETKEIGASGVKWETNNKKVADVVKDEAEAAAYGKPIGTVIAGKELGAATITARSIDDKTISAFAWVTVVAPYATETPDRPIDITTNREEGEDGFIIPDDKTTDTYTILDNFEAETITLRTTEDVTMKIDNTKIATIKAQPKSKQAFDVKYVGSGTATITVTNRDKTTVKVILTVRDRSPKLPAAVTYVKGSAHGLLIDVLPSDNLSVGTNGDNMFDGMVVSEENKKWAKKEEFTITKSNDPNMTNKYLLTYTGNAPDANKKYTVGLRATKNGVEIGLAVPVTVNYIGKPLKITFKTANLNSFWEVDEKEIVISGKDLPTVDKLTLDETLADNFNIVKKNGKFYAQIDDNTRPDAKGKLVGSGKVTVTYKFTDGSTLDVPGVAIKFNVVRTAPKPVLSPAKQFAWTTNKNPDESPAEISATFYLAGTEGHGIALNNDTAVLQQKPTVGVSAFIESIEVPSSNAIKITLDKTNASAKPWKDKGLSIPLKLDVILDGMRTGTGYVPLTVTGTITTIDTKPVEKPEVTVKAVAKNNIDLMNRENTQIIFVPTLKNTQYAIDESTLPFFTGADADVEKANKMLYVEWDNGNAVIRARSTDEIEGNGDTDIIKGEKFNVKLAFALNDGKDTHPNNDPTKAVAITKSAVPIKPVQSAVKHNIPKVNTVYQSRAGINNAIVIDLKPTTPAGAAIKTFAFVPEKKAGKWVNNPNNAYWFQFDEVTQELHIWVRDSALVTPGKNVNLIFEATYEGQGKEKKGKDMILKQATIKIPVTVK